jgi:hypothetical protein
MRSLEADWFHQWNSVKRWSGRGGTTAKNADVWRRGRCGPRRLDGDPRSAVLARESAPRQFIRAWVQQRAGVDQGGLSDARGSEGAAHSQRGFESHQAELFVRRSKCWRTQRVAPGDEILIAPYAPGFYPILEMQSPLRTLVFLWPDTPATQERIEARPVNWVLLWDGDWDHRDELRFRDTHVLAWDHLQRHFAVSPVDELGKGCFVPETIQIGPIHGLRPLPSRYCLRATDLPAPRALDHSSGRLFVSPRFGGMLPPDGGDLSAPRLKFPIRQTS